jgi:hypothetical protein
MQERSATVVTDNSVDTQEALKSLLDEGKGKEAISILKAFFET